MAYRRGCAHLNRDRFAQSGRLHLMRALHRSASRTILQLHMNTTSLSVDIVDTVNGLFTGAPAAAERQTRVSPLPGYQAKIIWRPATASGQNGRQLRCSRNYAERRIGNIKTGLTRGKGTCILSWPQARHSISDLSM